MSRPLVHPNARPVTHQYHLHPDPLIRRPLVWLNLARSHLRASRPTMSRSALKMLAARPILQSERRAYFSRDCVVSPPCKLSATHSSMLHLYNNHIIHDIGSLCTGIPVCNKHLICTASHRLASATYIHASSYAFIRSESKSIMVH
jgi:hypothetical protein